ncbi:hypothetical protein GCM10027610_031350 [Dactylosporangium cerinum]
MPLGARDAESRLVGIQRSATDHRVSIVKQRPGHSVDPLDVRLVREALQCCAPQLRTGEARRENVGVARISEEADQPQPYHFVTGKGPDGGAAARRIVLDERLDVIDQ